jgi:hypothetical protein
VVGQALDVHEVVQQNVLYPTLWKLYRCLAILINVEYLWFCNI